MFHARMQSLRALAVAQADMISVSIFGGATADQIHEFIRSGHLDTSASGTAMPYDQETLRQIVKQSRGSMGILME